MKINDLLGEFGVFTTNEEAAILAKLKNPVPMSTLSETEQFRIEGLIRKSLVIKIGHDNPKVVANDQKKIQLY
jgi:hypothetical protein